MEREGGKEEGGGREGGRRREGRKEEVVGGEREREGGRREGWEGKGREGEKGVKTHSQHTMHIVTNQPIQYPKPTVITCGDGLMHHCLCKHTPLIPY